jgi:hypothetical protein
MEENMLFYSTKPGSNIEEDKLIKMLEDMKATSNVKFLNIVENEYAFFHYLKICKKGYGAERVSSVDFDPNLIKPPRYYELLSFRIYICELVFNAINLFPEISEYTITCQSENKTSYLKFGVFKEHIIDNSPCMGIFKSEYDNETFYLSLKDIKSLYMANRYPEVDQMTVTTLIVSLVMGSYTIPKVEVSYKYNNDHFKEILKFK